MRRKSRLFGDSITQGGVYCYLLQALLAGSGARIYNLGFSGDTSVSGLKRLESVMDRVGPDRVCLIMGMNDCRAGAFTTEEDNPARRADFDGYRKASETSIRKLLARNIRVFLSTPPAYNQYSVFPKRNAAPYKNSIGLARIGEIDRELGSRYALPVLELNAEVTRVYQAFPQARFSPDRVHPDRTVHAVMAAVLARGMGLSPLVGDVAIAGDSVRAEAAEVAEFRRDGGVIGYAYTPGRLPLGDFTEFQEARQYFALDQYLNREILRVADLAPGRYAVCIDGGEVGTFSAEELKTGVDLARLNTPHRRQADANVPLIRAFEKAMNSFAVNQRFRSMVTAAHKNYDDARERRAVLAEWYEKGRKHPTLGQNFEKLYRLFLDEIDGREAEIADRCAALHERIAESGRPKRCRVSIAPVR